MASHRFTVTLMLAITFIATVATLHGQGRGRGFHGGMPARAGQGPAVAARSNFGVRHSAPVVAPRVFNRPGVNIVRPLPRVGPVWRGVVAPQPFIGFPYSPFLGSPFYSSPAYVEPAYVAPAYASPTYVVPQESRSEADLRYEVQRLRNEIEALRLERPSVLPAPPQLPEPAPVPPAAPTVLVFRDGLRMFIRNYAIIGQTLWVLDERAASKIALSDLDLETTQKENRTQGVRFPLPAR